MPDDDEAVTSRPVFHAVVTVMLSDGELTMEERRLAIKLGSLLFKGDDLETEPKLIYDAVVAGEPVEGGRVIDKQERLEICRKMIETAYVNSSLSQDELVAIAMLRSAMAITEGEILEVRADIYRDLEEEVEPKLLGKVRKDIREIFQKVEEFILPKSD